MGRRQKTHISSDQLHFSVTGRGYGEEKNPADFLTVREAAKLMRIGRDMAYALVAESDGDSIRFTADRAKRFSTHFLAYGCLLVFTEAAELISEGLLEEPRGFREAGAGVWRYWRWVEGKDPTGPIRP